MYVCHHQYFSWLDLGSASKKKTVTSTHVHPHGQGSTKIAKRKLDRSPSKDPKRASVDSTKKFWEDHNKVQYLIPCKLLLNK